MRRVLPRCQFNDAPQTSRRTVPGEDVLGQTGDRIGQNSRAIPAEARASSWLWDVEKTDDEGRLCPVSRMSIQSGRSVGDPTNNGR